MRLASGDAPCLIELSTLAMSVGLLLSLASVNVDESLTVGGPAPSSPRRLLDLPGSREAGVSLSSELPSKLSP